jgi:hypothetical protein
LHPSASIELSSIIAFALDLVLLAIISTGALTMPLSLALPTDVRT